LIRALARVGYVVTRQTGSHVCLTCELGQPHHITVPIHDPLRVGTLAAIVADVAQAHGVEREALLRELFG
jgi:predicted RNA binding protein YcfA (HicA-like mRNA interferase family)